MENIEKNQNNEVKEVSEIIEELQNNPAAEGIDDVADNTNMTKVEQEYGADEIQVLEANENSEDILASADNGTFTSLQKKINESNYHIHQVQKR